MATSERYCEQHIKGPPAKLYAKARASSSERGYTHRWQMERRAFLLRHPVCVECERHGVFEMAKVVDHIIPHKGDMELFWRVSNWQALCVTCHNVKTASEDGGFGNQ